MAQDLLAVDARAHCLRAALVAAAAGAATGARGGASCCMREILLSVGRGRRREAVAVGE